MAASARNGCSPRICLAVPAQAYVGLPDDVQGFPAAADGGQLQSGSGNAETTARD